MYHRIPRDAARRLIARLAANGFLAVMFSNGDGTFRVEVFETGQRMFD